AGMHRVFHLHSFASLVVIGKIHAESVSMFKTKSDPPIRADGHRVTAFQIPFEGVQVKGRHVHAFNLLCGMQGRENEAEPRQHFQRQFAAVIVLKKALQSFVAKPLYHPAAIVKRKITFYKSFLRFPCCADCLRYSWSYPVALKAR